MLSLKLERLLLLFCLLLVRIRAHISVLTKPSKELLQLLTELVGWLRDVNEEIDGNSVLAGDSVMLAVHYEQSQVRKQCCCCK